MALRRWGGALLLAIVLVAVGCGGGGDKSKASSSSSSSSSSSKSSKSSSSASRAGETVSGKTFTAALCEQISTISPRLRDVAQELNGLVPQGTTPATLITDEEIAALGETYVRFGGAVDDAVAQMDTGPAPDVKDGEEVKADVVAHLTALRDAAETAAVGLDGLTPADAAAVADAIRGWGTDAEAALNDLGDDFSGPLKGVTDPSCIDVVVEFKSAAAGGG